MPKQRIVITGLGVISPFGDGINPFWDAVSTGKNGIGPVTLFDATELNCRVAAECKEFDATKYMDPKEAKRSDRYTHFAVAAAKLALKDANIKEGDVDPERFGVLIGSGVGGMDTIEKQSRAFIERGARRVSPFMIPNLLANMSSGVVAIDVGAKGVNFSVVSACATGTHAIGEALLHLQMGREDIILAGGSEAALQGVVRNEWGFKGAIITDYIENATYMDQDQALRSGGNLGLAGGLNMTYNSSSSARIQNRLQESVKQVVYSWLHVQYINSQYNASADVGQQIISKVTPVFEWWKPMLLDITILDFVACAIWGYFIIQGIVLDKKKKREGGKK